MLFQLKIEMSTSAEAKALWNAYRVNKIGEITAVKPGHELVGYWITFMV